MSEKHTPTPWVRNKYDHLVDAKGKEITVSGLGIAMRLSGHSDETKANSALIVRAVNNFQPMLDALEGTTELVRLLHTQLSKVTGGQTIYTELLDKAEAAIKSAKGEM